MIEITVEQLKENTIFRKFVKDEMHVLRFQSNDFCRRCI